MTYQSTGHVMDIDPAIKQANAIEQLLQVSKMLLDALTRTHATQIEPLLRDIRDTMRRIEQLQITQNNKLEDRHRYRVSGVSDAIKRLTNDDWATIAQFFDANAPWPTNDIYQIIDDVKQQVRYGKDS